MSEEVQLCLAPLVHPDPQPPFGTGPFVYCPCKSTVLRDFILAMSHISLYNARVMPSHSCDPQSPSICRPPQRHPKGSKKRSKPNQTHIMDDSIRSDLNRDQLLQLCRLLLLQQPAADASLKDADGGCNNQEALKLKESSKEVLHIICGLLSRSSCDPGSGAEALAATPEDLVALLIRLPPAQPNSCLSASDEDRRLADGVDVDAHTNADIPAIDGEVEDEDEVALMVARQMHQAGLKALSEKGVKRPRRVTEHNENNPSMHIEEDGIMQSCGSDGPAFISKGESLPLLRSAQPNRWRVYDGPWQPCALGCLPCTLKPTGQHCPLGAIVAHSSLGPDPPCSLG